MTNKEQSSWQDLPLRIISAIIIIPVVMTCIIYGGWFYIGMIACISFLMAIEWENLFRVKRQSFTAILYLFWTLIAYYAAIQGMWIQALSIVLGFAFIFGPQLWLGSAVIGCAGLSLLWLRFMTGFEAWVILWLIAVVIASDSFAYIVGKIIGGPKLIPAISPGKTWSGAIGGLIGAGLIGALMIGYLNQGTGEAFIVGGILSSFVGIVAQSGDLLESKLKRSLGVKDSGRIIPGHGGLLDRCDALLAVSIFVVLLSFMLPSVIVGVKWDGGLLKDKQSIMKTVPIIPLSLFR